MNIWQRKRGERPPKRVVDPSVVDGLRASAYQSGVVADSPSRTVWDISGDCSGHAGFELSYTGGDPVLGEDAGFQAIEMKVRCRSCTECRRFRSWQWSERAKLEVAYARATLFGTCTVAPEHQLTAWYAVTAQAHEEGVPTETLTDEECFALRCQVLGKEITRYQKRLRKELSPAVLRFVWFAEPHPGEGPHKGLPHFHCLVHVVDWQPGERLHELDSDPEKVELFKVYQACKKQWWLGHSVFITVDDENAREILYTCKYTAKQAKARVRASLRYGLTRPERTPDQSALPCSSQREIPSAD